MKTLILTLIITFSFFSCSNSDDFYFPISEFQGKWNGTYTGDGDNGTWIMTVDQNGYISGTVTSNVFNETFDGNGAVRDSGSVNMSIGTTSSGATFEGKMIGESVLGTWSNDSEVMNGNWIGDKE